MKNYYDILAVKKDASQEEIKKSYRKLSKQYHPDLNPNNKEAEIRFREITEAYAVLGNQDARTEYNAKLHTADGNKDFQKPEKPKADRPQYSSEEFNIGDVGRQFEKFFGFDPKTGERNQTFANAKQENKKGPLDASHIFEGFFRPKKK